MVLVYSYFILRPADDPQDNEFETYDMSLLEEEAEEIIVEDEEKEVSEEAGVKQGDSYQKIEPVSKPVVTKDKKTLYLKKPKYISDVVDVTDEALVKPSDKPRKTTFLKVKFLKKPEFDPASHKKSKKVTPLRMKLSHDDHGDIMLYSKPRYTYKTISFHNLNTGESLKTIFFQNGQYSAAGMEKINHFLRDYRNGKVIKIDPKLIMLVYRISKRVGFKGNIEVISGYRSKQTNDRLRRMGRNVAKNSMHTHGKAIDIRLPGVSTKRLRNVAQSYRAGGVGYYPKDGFVHVDTGPLRNW